MQSPDAHDEIIILGCGLVGLCTALSLLERGEKVRLIDRDEPGQATSMGNAGVVSPWSIIPQPLPGIWKAIPRLLFGYGRPLSIDPRVVPAMVPWAFRFLRQSSERRTRLAADAMSHLCGPSIELYERHLRGTGHESLLCDSYYVHAFRKADASKLQAIDYRIREEKGADLELVGQERLLKIEPALSPDFKAAVLIKGQSRIRSPGQLGKVLADKVRALGGAIERVEIRSLRKDNGRWRITCQNKQITAQRVVVAMGVWSKKLLESFGIAVPLLSERGYHIECRDPQVELNHSVMDVDAKVVASSMNGGVRIAGQAEFAPIEKPADERRRVVLLRVARAAFPGLRTEEHSFWMGQRPSFPDSLPALGKIPGHPGLFANFGHSHYGLMMAPKSGAVAAQIVCGEVPNIPLEPYSLGRFG